MFSLDEVALVAIIIGLVEVVKAFAVPSKWCLVASLAVGVALLLALEATYHYPTISPWILAALKGIVLALSASGLYMVSKKFRPNGPETPTLYK